PPTVTITAPVDGSTFSPPSITVTGTATDLLSGVASITCRGVPATMSGSNFTCVAPIVAGPNSIVVQAIDAAGNTGQAMVSVQGGSPVILSVNPASAQQGQANLAVTTTGQYTNFVQGVTQATFGPDISVGGAAEGTLGPVTVTSPTTATAQLV